METLLYSTCSNSRRGLGILVILMILLGQRTHISAAPHEWMYSLDRENFIAWSADDPDGDPPDQPNSEAMVALSCLPDVNVSLGQLGYAVITSIMLVNAPDYPAFQYEVDIMGPLNDTVFCDQLGLDLMVVVTELPTGNSCMSSIFIEDKLKPVLTCTPDTLPCNVDIFEIDFEDYLDDVSDNCDPDPDVFYSFVIQNLPCNPHHFTQKIIVTWTATDESGNSSTCQDCIYLERPAIGQIDFPADVTVDCLNANTDPSVTGEPTYLGEPLGLTCQYVVFYTDQVVPMCNGAQKILRLWTVMDWCNSAQRTDVQEILIIDDVPPTIICPANITVNTSPGVCTTKYTLPLPVVSDACANDNMIDIDFFVSGVPGFFSPGDMVNLGLGTTVITIKATDPCANSSMCSYTVTVKDNVPPIIICPGNVTVSCIESTDPSNTGTATATDNCDPTPTITFTDVTTPTSNCGIGYNIMRTWKATDDSGNMSICMQMIILTDNVPPLITCPANLTITCTASTLPATTGSATATDLCDTLPVITFSDVTIAGTCPQEKTINRTWKATDDCGNSSTCLQVISVEDNIPPVITCPQDVTIECAEDSGPGNTGTATATDICDPTPTITFSDVTFPGGAQQFTVNRTWKATDDCGNSSTCLQIIVVNDETPPVIICPPNVTIQCTASTLPPNTGTATATDNCDQNPLITFSDVVTGGPCPQELTILRTWVAADDCGNSSSCTQTISVDDSMAPAITCPPNTTIQCTASTLPANTGTATATDNCDAVPTIAFSDVTVGGSCPQERTITRTWTATDDCGNSSSCVQTIVVDDSVAPAITCPANTTIECTESTLPANTGSATATDLCDTSPAITFSDVTTAGSCPQEHTRLRTWTATDDCGNSSTCVQTIAVVDNTAPLITCPSNVTIDCSTSTLPPSTGSATATDNCDPTPSITFSDVTIGSGGCPQEFTINRTWNAADDCGNSSTCLQIILVNDGTPPAITCPDDITISCSESTLPPNTGTATATDNCDLTPSITFSDMVVGGPCPLEGSIIRTWTAADDCGNSSTCTQVIVIDDSQAPAITCPPNVTIQCDENTLPANTGTATATDNCDASPTVTFSDITTGGSCPDELTITRTWVATDDCSNSGSCIQIILVTDDTAPAMFCPANTTIECTESTAPANTGTATGSDICDASVTITFADVTVGGACPQLFTITRTWTGTDDCGNSGTCNQTIVLEDTTDPECETVDITVTLDGSGFAMITASQVDGGSSDNCGPVELSVVPDTFNCDNLGDNTVVLTVTDCSGNSSTCTATVTIEDSGVLTAMCQDITIFLDANGVASVDPEDVNDGSGGGCAPGTLEFELSQTDFDCSNVGPNVVTLTVTDGDGNTATCTATITVVDNMPPNITCPPNVTVDCDELTDPNNTGQFGDATATDNCPFVITEVFVVNLNDCGIGTITRTFTATDASGNTDVCTQVVTVSNPDPFTEDDITWPPSPISVNICNSTDPEDLPNGFPVFDPGALQCANPMATYVDQVQMIVDNNPNTPCKIITRTWTVTDSCQPGVEFEFVQTINVIDMVPPLFTNINNMMATANEDCVAFFTIIASATDCAGVSITNNSPYGVNTGANASGFYPIGVTTVIFTGTDGCGNISTMDVVVTVIDSDPTTFQCEKVIFFMPKELEIDINAIEFITFISGNCTDENDFIISYSSTDPYDTVNTYDCSDVGVTTFSLWFWNAAGTMKLDSCNTADLDFRDPDDLCNDGLVLAGNVKSEDGLAVGGVEVSIMNVPMAPSMTNANGKYVIGGLAEGTAYEVAPFNDEYHREGVSTLDLVLIQKHLLGRAKLTTPYKMIAADANKSGHLTALDLLEIRKVILGINSRFPNNTSWRFIDKNYSFPDPFNPFNVPFAESIWIDSVTQGIAIADFIGIKTGDVNGSYFKNLGSDPKIEIRSAATYNFTMYSDLPQSKRNQIKIFASERQEEMEGFQFSLFIGDIGFGSLEAIQSEVLNADDWYYDDINGLLNVSWSSGIPRDLSGKLILGISDPELAGKNIEMVSSSIAPEAYRDEAGSMEILELILSPSVEKETIGNEYQLFQNRPNPFLDGTSISFTLPQPELIRIVIYDMAGKQVFEHKSECQAGYNEVYVKGDGFKSPGIYYYTLHTANASFTRKMSFTNN